MCKQVKLSALFYRSVLKKSTAYRSCPFLSKRNVTDFRLKRFKLTLLKAPALKPEKQKAASIPNKALLSSRTSDFGTRLERA